jgi:hypothetical protein
MNWFGLGSDKKTPTPAPLAQRKASPRTPSAAAETATPGHSLTTLSAKQMIITSLADFPSREDVLSSTTSSNPALRIPEALQDFVILIKTSATRAVLVYDPAQTAKVKDYFNTLRNAVAINGAVVRWHKIHYLLRLMLSGTCVSPRKQCAPKRD